MATDRVPNSVASPSSGAVRVRLWASARAAAGTPELTLDLPGDVADGVTVGRLRSLVVEALPDRPGLSRVLEVCSVLLGDEPVHDDAATVAPGSTVEFLPPFAGG